MVCYPVGHPRHLVKCSVEIIAYVSISLLALMHTVEERQVVVDALEYTEPPCDSACSRPCACVSLAEGDRSIVFGIHGAVNVLINGHFKRQLAHKSKASLHPIRPPQAHVVPQLTPDRLYQGPPCPRPEADPIGHLLPNTHSKVSHINRLAAR